MSHCVRWWRDDSHVLSWHLHSYIVCSLIKGMTRDCPLSTQKWETRCILSFSVTRKWNNQALFYHVNHSQGTIAETQEKCAPTDLMMMTVLHEQWWQLCIKWEVRHKLHLKIWTKMWQQDMLRTSSVKPQCSHHYATSSRRWHLEKWLTCKQMYSDVLCTSTALMVSQRLISSKHVDCYVLTDDSVLLSHCYTICI